MIFTEAPLSGAFVIEPELLEDTRGFFARTWCGREFEARGLVTRVAQGSTSFNKNKGTLRGMHYQVPPFAETKIVRCVRGSMYDAIVDLRPGSPTFTQHFTVVLTAENRKMLYVPAGFAHGFQTLEDDTEVFYQISEFYSPRTRAASGGTTPRSGSPGLPTSAPSSSAIEPIPTSTRT